jgi:hypothetical protein
LVCFGAAGGGEAVITTGERVRSSHTNTHTLKRRTAQHTINNNQQTPTQAQTPAPGKLKEFKQYLETEGASRADVQALRAEVEALAGSFPMPGL